MDVGTELGNSVTTKAFCDNDNNDLLRDKLHYGLGISLVTLDIADKLGSGNNNKFLDYVFDWLNKRPENAVDECYFPSKNWVKNLISHFHFTEEEQNTIINSNQNGAFTYMHWKNLILKMIKRLKATISIQKNYTYSEAPAKQLEYQFQSSAKPFIPRKNIFMQNSKPLDFMETRCLEEAKRLYKNTNVFQIYGTRGTGKKYILNALLNELQGQVDHIIVFNMNTTYFDFKDQINHTIAKLKKHDWISTQQTNLDANKTPVNDLFDLAKQLTIHQIKMVLVFSINTYDLSCNFATMLRDFTQAILKGGKQNIFTTILVTPSQDTILDRTTASFYSTSFQQVEIDGFTPLEATKFLRLNLGDECNYYAQLDRYSEDVSVTGIVNIFTVEGAERIYKYFDCNPCCLKAAKEYCITRRVSYIDYSNSVEESPFTRRFIHNVSAQILESGTGNAEAYMSIHNLKTVHNNENAINVSQILHVLMFLSNEDIPVLLLEKICKEIRIQNSDLTLTDSDHSWLNVNEAADFIYRLNKQYSCNVDSPILHPSGIINKIPQMVYDAELCAIKVEDGERKQNLFIAVRVILSMVSKDNREFNADKRLATLINHIEKLAKHAKTHLELKLDLRAPCSENFLIFMGICRLLELLGQGIIQDRLKMRVDQALKFLMWAATMIMDIMSTYKKYSGLLCPKLTFKNPTDYTELIGFPSILDAQHSKKEAKKRAKKIAKLCLYTSKVLRPKITTQYLCSTLILSAKNFEEFRRNIMKTKNLSANKAKHELHEVFETVQLKLGLTEQHVVQLRSMGNLLQPEDYANILFAERLSGIFHTYGRASHYNHGGMDSKDIKKCEYYCFLSQEIAKQIRLLTKIGLINEYLPKAAAVAKSIQNVESETDNERMQRLDKAYRDSRNLLVVPGTFYEDGKFREVEGSVYTELHAYRCMVKVNTKMLKLRAWGGWSDEAKYRSLKECDTLLEITLGSKSLDMAPHCLVQVARFYAAAEKFELAFEIYERAFYQQEENGTYGIDQLYDKRPNTCAWAVYNFCFSLQLYSESGLAERKLDVLKLRANKRLGAILLNPKVDDDWKKPGGNLRQFVNIFK